MEKIFEASWSTYEEYCSVNIFYENKKYYCNSEGHNVYVGDYKEELILESDEAIEIIEDCYDQNYDVDF
jgi:hypothetical protein